MGRETRQPRNINPKLNYKGAGQGRVPKSGKLPALKSPGFKAGKKK